MQLNSLMPLYFLLLLEKRDLFVSTVNQYEFKELKEKYSEEAKECKDLYSKLIELRLAVYSVVSLYSVTATIGENWI